MQLNSASRKESALWLLDKLLPGTGVNNIPVAFRLEGKLQAPVVADAISLLLQRHEALRTVFYADSAGLTKCIMPVERGELSVDFDQMEEGEDVNVAISRYALKPFSFDGSPLIRAGIFRGDGGDALCLVGHHLIFDVISADVLLKEFLTVYSDISRGGSNVGNRSKRSLRIMSRNLKSRVSFIGVRAWPRPKRPTRISGTAAARTIASLLLEAK